MVYKPTNTGWWWLEHGWIMTFHEKQLGMELQEESSQLTFTPRFFQRG